MGKRLKEESTIEKFQKRVEKMVDSVTEENNITRKQLAEEMGLNEKTLNAYVLGKRLPEAENLKIIAKYFNCTTDYLLSLTDADTPNLPVRQICDFTGLSVNSVEELHKYKKSEVASTMLDLINNLIEPLVAWTAHMVDANNEKHGFDYTSYEELEIPEFPEMTDEELEASYRDIEKLEGEDTVEKLASALNGDSILELLHSYLYANAKRVLYYIDAEGHIHESDPDEPIDGNPVAYMNGALIAERYFLDAITNKIKEMKNNM